MSDKPMPKKGDRVRVTVEGEVIATDPTGFRVASGPDGIGKWFTPELSASTVVSYEILPPPLPEEPPVGSVVLDKDGAAWQRRESGWRYSFVDCFTWSELHAEYGPLRIIHRGGE